jgi:hypothetical protein
MANLDVPGRGKGTASGRYRPDPRTLIPAAAAAWLARVARTIPAALSGLCQQDLVPASSELTWVSDAFRTPVCLSI